MAMEEIKVSLSRGEHHKMLLTTLAWVVAHFSWRCHDYS